MEKTKKLRSAQRTAFTKIYNVMMNMIADTTPDLVELEGNLRILDQKFERLNELNMEINDALLEADCSADELDLEIAGVDEYLSKYSRVRIRVERFLRKEQAESSTSATNISVSTRRKLKLPTIEFCKFGGEIKSWLSFWSQFQRIHDDSSIDNEDKFQYLIQATVPNSRARQLIDSYPPTGDNYPKAIDSLKSRFGRNDLLVEVYVRELLSLVLNTMHEKIKLSDLYDKMESQLRALETLVVTSETCAAMLYPMVESCLPEETLRAWQRSSSCSNKLSLKDRLKKLMDFLKDEVENEERISLAVAGFDVNKSPRKLAKNKCVSQNEGMVATAAGLLNQKSVIKCVFCNEKHTSSECNNNKHTYEEKSRILKEKGCCFVCLRFGHTARKCRLRVKCPNCNGRHMKIMCNNESKIETKSTTSESLSNHTHGEVLLQTLLVKVIGERNTRYARAIIDTGSQRSYITKTLSREMDYEPVREEYLAHSLFGGVESERIKHVCYHVKICNLNDKYKCDFDVLDQPVICNNLGCIIQGPWMQELQKLNILISDRYTGPIEILIGADVEGKLLTGRRYSLNCGLVAVETSLGWTLMGKIPQTPPQNSSMLVTSLFSSNFSISDYWELDVLGITDPHEQQSKKDEELAVMDNFLQNVIVNDEGRYEVKMPWIEGHSPLPSYLDVAKRRLDTLTAKLKNEGYYDAYHQVICEWREEGIIEEVPEKDISETALYLPHRHVVKSNSSTTKIRPVFDASAKLKNHPSLNQCLIKGVNLIELISSLLIRFRLHQIGVVSDIRKAFLQISLTPGDRDFLRFLWYDDASRIKCYRHCRVVFGVTCSPFLLSSVINFHLQNILDKALTNSAPYSNWVISKLMRSFYVDNCVTSVDTLAELHIFIEEASNIMLDGKFDLRGWEHTILNRPLDQVNTSNDMLTPVLGLLWNKYQDILMLNTECIKDIGKEVVTKRTILSSSHRIFDPIGFTCPVSLYPKMLLQKLWQTKIGWDTEIEGDIKISFLRWLEELSVLKDLTLPRWLGYQPLTTTASLHVFCDASQDAYAVAIFLRLEMENIVRINLVQAKSRVSPVKKLSIPRLELMAATIGARLSVSVSENIHIEGVKMYWWTDSTTVLSWIKTEEIWKPFVRNRVQEICRLTDKNSWYHVPGDSNPADLPSRGCTPKKLVELRWWEGPVWLRKPMEEWPIQRYQCDKEVVYSEKGNMISSLLNSENKATFDCFYEHFSKFDSIVKMIGYIRRFIHNCRNRNQKRTGVLSLEEFSESETQLIKFIQLESFEGVADNTLSSFCPFLDGDDIIRVRTKITECSDSPEFCNPIVLPAKHPVVTKLIYDNHLKYSHVGIQGLMSILRERFWIIRGRKTIGSVIHKCVTCRRYDSKKLETSPVTLPHDRVRDAVAFEVTGVDLAGPLYIRNGEKVWICIFTCGVYRALHLELVSTISTNAFLQAFRRFVARRGRPLVIYSDHGTNFVGADNAFGKLDWKAIAEFSTVQKIHWKFNPVTAAWWGGWWERLIRLVKQLLRKVLGRACLTYEELSTVLCDCESVLNSRPITYASENTSDLIPLTPNMFVRDMGPKSGLTSELPDVDTVESSDLNRHVRYRQKLRENLRQRFRREYLGELILHSKRRTRTNSMKIGSIVLIRNDNTKRIDWPLAMIEELLPGKDGKVRLVRLRTKTGHLIRPIQRIFPLEVDAEDPNAITKPVGIANTRFPTPTTQSIFEEEEEAEPEEECPSIVTRYGRKIKPPKKFSY